MSAQHIHQYIEALNTLVDLCASMLADIDNPAVEEQITGISTQFNLTQARSYLAALRVGPVDDERFAIYDSQGARIGDFFPSADAMRDFIKLCEMNRRLPGAATYVLTGSDLVIKQWLSWERTTGQKARSARVDDLPAKFGGSGGKVSNASVLDAL